MLENLTGPESEFRPRSNLDRYGFSFLLMKEADVKYRYRPFCDWIHGWAWWEDHLQPEDLIGPRGHPYDYSLIVGSETEGLILRASGYRNIHVGGLPFSYVPNQKVIRNEHILLAFIAHSAENERMHVIDARYLDFLESQRNQFENIYVSMYSLDRSGRLIDEVVKRGLTPFAGANPNDRNSLVRMRRALEYCANVSSNTFGSHISYALSCDCRVSLFVPMYKYDTVKYKDSGFPKDYADRIEYVTSEAYLRDRWPYLFDLKITDGYRNLDEGCVYIGCHHRLDRRQLRAALGWTVGGQVAGYTSGAIRRLLASINAG
jgi:hypothetical protein